MPGLLDLMTFTTAGGQIDWHYLIYSALVTGGKFSTWYPIVPGPWLEYFCPWDCPQCSMDTAEHCPLTGARAKQTLSTEREECSTEQIVQTWQFLWEQNENVTTLNLFHPPTNTLSPTQDQNYPAHKHSIACFFSEEPSLAPHNYWCDRTQCSKLKDISNTSKAFHKGETIAKAWSLLLKLG